MWPVSFKSKTILPFDYLSSVHTVKTLKHHSLIIDSLWWIVISCYRLKKAGIRTQYSKLFKVLLQKMIFHNFIYWLARFMYKCFTIRTCSEMYSTMCANTHDTTTFEVDDMILKYKNWIYQELNMTSMK